MHAPISPYPCTVCLCESKRVLPVMKPPAVGERLWNCWSCLALSSTEIRNTSGPNASIRNNKHTQSQLQPRRPSPSLIQTGRKGRHERNALVMSLTSCYIAPIRVGQSASSEMNGWRTECVINMRMQPVHQQLTEIMWASLSHHWVYYLKSHFCFTSPHALSSAIKRCCDTMCWC